MKAKPVILSGGSGVRLWPISRKNLAKQFVDLFQNNSSLFMETIKRVSNQLFTKPLIISNNSQRFEVLKLIKKHVIHLCQKNKFLHEKFHHKKSILYNFFQNNIF